MLTHAGTQTIETERLTLRRFTTKDADDMLKSILLDPEKRIFRGGITA